MARRDNHATGNLIPSARRQREARHNHALLAEEEFRPTGNPAHSLMRSVSGRRPGAKPQHNSLLRKLADERPTSYAELLGRLMTGASLRAATTLLGLSYDMVRGWIAQGLIDGEQQLDTYYSRFAADVHSAIAYCVADCEQRVTGRNPAAYLTSGTGRSFFAVEGTWQPQQQPHQQQLDAEALAPLALRSDSDSAALPGPSPEKCAAAIAVLAQSGIVPLDLAATVSAQYSRPSLPDDTVPDDTVQPSTTEAAPAESQPDGSFHALLDNCNGEVVSPASGSHPPA